ncbi:MAG: hypothetical protein EOO61_15315 [Hymenobacter sp.]|nr:MAG: hypothetical protein EOO61_15315 [Hymenobacter sp.]
MMTRLNLDELDEGYTVAGSPILLLDGQPFTGVAYELNSQGELWSEQGYRDGVLDGISRDWYSNGILKSETTYKWNRVHGHDQGWYENGKPAYKSVYELGTRLREQRWNEQGQLVSDYHLDTASPKYVALVQTKALFQQQGLTP